VTLAELALHLHCSSRTVQRRLADWSAINSYNRNGSCYTLPDMPAFDAHGLWRYRGACFSRFGNLPETFAGLVANAPAGLTAAEAGELLGLRPSSFLWSLREHSAILREKTQGRFVYYHADAAVGARQRERRGALQATSREPTPSEAIAILVEQIKHPEWNHEALSRQLRKKKLSIDAESIRNFFLRHGLTVKKTPPSI
jgi:hypothetical protein